MISDLGLDIVLAVTWEMVTSFIEEMRRLQGTYPVIFVSFAGHKLDNCLYIM